MDTYELIARYASDMLSIHDPNGAYLFVTPSCTRLFGWTQEQLQSKRVHDLIHPDDLERVARNLAIHHLSGEPPPVRYQFQCADRTYRCVETRSRAHHENGHPDRIVCITRDITELVQQERRLEKLATTDPLTDLANRRTFLEALHRLQLEAERGRDGALVMGDIDHFKQFNDTYGHLAGDSVLRMVADVIRNNVRQLDTAARVGGEEFGIVLVGADARQGAMVAERIRRDLEATETPYGVVTMSFGVCAIRSGSGDTDHESNLRRCADGALYLAKRRGRNRVEVGLTGH